MIYYFLFFFSDSPSFENSTMIGDSGYIDGSAVKSAESESFDSYFDTKDTNLSSCDEEVQQVTANMHNETVELEIGGDGTESTDPPSQQLDASVPLDECEYHF